MHENEDQPRPPQAATAPAPAAADDHARQANQWAMFVHFSSVGFVIPLVGLVLPIVLWQLKKDEFPSVDAHGKVVVNWLISALCYSLVSLALTLAIGVYGFMALFMALGIATLIFAIVGGIKANDGELWEYPLSIKFLK